MSRFVDATATSLDPLELAPDDVLAGTPSAASRPFATLGGLEVGVWSLTEGTVRDVEADEVFVVLEGDATVRFADGEEVHLVPERLVRLHAGERTEWIVRKTLRKVYVA